jgi:thioredoxin 2
VSEAVVVACPNCGKRNRVPKAATGAPRCATCHAPLPFVVDAGDGDFDAVVTQSRLPVLVDLWAPWCGPCRMVGPAVEQLGSQLAGALKVVRVNVDEAPGVASRFDARSIPTLLVLDRGRVLARQVGAVPATVLRRFVDDALATKGHGERRGAAGAR